MTLEERRNRSDLIEMFKISKGISAIPWNSFFRADHTKRTRGHSRKVAKDGFRSTGYKEEFLFAKNRE